MTVRRILSRLPLALGAFLAPIMALAAEPPQLPCGNLPGCNDVGNLLAESTFPTIISTLMAIAGGGAVLMGIWGGFQMVFANGDEGTIEKGRKFVMYAAGGLAFAISANSLVGFIASEDYTAGNDDLILGLLISGARILLTLFNVVLTIVIVLAGMRMVITRGNSGEFSKASKTILWALVGAVVANLARAIMDIVLNIFA